MSVFFILGFLLVAGVVVLGLTFWIWMLIDCASNEPGEGNDKIIWIVILVFLHLLGAVLYFFIRRPRRIEETGR